MVKITTGVMVVVLLYLLLDIKRSMGLVRHITPPACSPKDLFVRLPSFIQLMASIMVIAVFPVKKPEMKTGKTGMMGTTVVSNSSSSEASG